MTYYLGLDGGGSKTTCVIGNDSVLLGSAVSGPSNITRVGEEGARKSLHQAILEACAAAKIAPSQLRSSCIGAAGAGREDSAAAVRRIVAEVIPGHIEVVGDMQVALHAAFGQGPGVIVVAGTGSIAYGRDVRGKTARAGGWGFAISDEGSAHWIGRTAIAELLRLQDEACNDRLDPQSSQLFQELKDIWKVDTLERLASRANASPDFAVLLPAINSAAAAGDAIARRIFSQAATELARLAALVLNKLFKDDDTQRAIPLAMVGGVFRHCATVRQFFLDEVRKLNRPVEVKPHVVQPVYGALAMARDGISTIAVTTAPGRNPA